MKKGIVVQYISNIKMLKVIDKNEFVKLEDIGSAKVYEDINASDYLNKLWELSSKYKIQIFQYYDSEGQETLSVDLSYDEVDEEWLKPLLKTLTQHQYKDIKIKETKDIEFKPSFAFFDKDTRISSNCNLGGVIYAIMKYSLRKNNDK